MARLRPLSSWLSASTSAPLSGGKPTSAMHWSLEERAMRIFDDKRSLAWDTFAQTVHMFLEMEFGALRPGDSVTVVLAYPSDSVVIETAEMTKHGLPPFEVEAQHLFPSLTIH